MDAKEFKLVKHLRRPGIIEYWRFEFGKFEFDLNPEAPIVVMRTSDKRLHVSLTFVNVTKPEVIATLDDYVLNDEQIMAYKEMFDDMLELNQKLRDEDIQDLRAYLSELVTKNPQ